MGTAFDMQELYLMPFLLMLLFIGIFAITSMVVELGVVGHVLRRFLE